MIDVFVSSARKTNQENVSLLQRRCDLLRGGNRMRRFERRDDALFPCEQEECRNGLLIGDGEVSRTFDVLQKAVLRTDSWVIKTGRDAMRLEDLAILVLQTVTVRPVQGPRSPHAERSAMFARLQPFSSRFHTNELYVLVSGEML